MTELSNVEKVVLAIYKHNKENVHVYHGTLIEELQISRHVLGISLDKLFDLCMIDAKWETIDRKWVRCYHTSHAYDSYLEALFNETK